ncbi:Ubiquitin hydrolase [Trachipleistophora hominis]|uniref:Ubiquitin hydrolase n=1 Tax=Trachipleistophora hominis TaxID=72359 RepID=L7JUT3_TRAHO|nr:Ubiquitin hydrolase [Trachipleistophora hominis]
MLTNTSLFHLLYVLVCCDVQYMLDKKNKPKMDKEGRFIPKLFYNDTQFDDYSCYSSMDNFMFKAPACIYQSTSFSRNNYKDLIAFSEQTIYNIENNLPVLYSRHVIEKIRRNPECGLVNFNAHCYINAVVQILFSSQKFVKCMQANAKKCKILHLLNELYMKMKNHMLVSPLSTYLKISEQCNILFNVYERSGYSSDVICTISKNLENHSIRIMSIKANQECFWKYPLLDIVDDGNVQERINKLLERKPNIKFGEIIVFTGFLTDNMLRCHITDCNVITIKNVRYKLLGILERVLNNFNGYHIIAFAKRNNEWFMFNDECVLKINANEVLENKETYYIFYEII